MFKKKIYTVVSGALIALASTSALADVSVSLSPANPTISPVGANSALITLNFTGDGVATSFQGALSFDDVQFDITSLTSVGTAVCSPPADENGAGVVTLTFSKAEGTPIASGGVCTFVLDHVGVATGDTPYTFSALLAEDAGANGVNITSTNGVVTVSAGPPTAPTITYAPNPVLFAAGGSFPADVDVNVTPTASGGVNGGVTEVTCSTSSPGFSIPTAATTCTDNTCVPSPLVFRCAQTNVAQNGTATCTATPTNPAGAPVNTNLTLTCEAANVAPTLTYNPVPTTPIIMPTVGQGQTSNSSIAVTPSAGSGTSTSTVGNCAFSAVVGATFTAPVGTLTFTGSSTTAQNLNFSCVAPTNGQPDGTATLTCDQTIGGGMPTQVTWPVTCPDGLPVAAPSVIYTPAAGPITFPQGASIGSTTAGAPTINVDITGGADDGMGAAETTSVACTVPAGFTVTGSPVGPIGVGDPTPDTDGTIAVSCVAAATAQAGNMTCTASQSVNGVVTTADTLFALDCPAAAVNIASNPAEGNIDLFGVPATTLNGSITLTNIGADSTLACVAVAGTANVTLGVVPATVPANGSAVIPFTCTAGAPGAALTGSIQCTTQDPDAEATLDYTVNCTGLSSNPIPAISDLGKMLMVALVIGLGLLGLGARRQMV